MENIVIEFYPVDFFFPQQMKHLVIDGGWLLRQVKWNIRTQTWADIIQAYVKFVQKLARESGADIVTVVTNGSSPCPKDPTHLRRYKIVSAAVMIRLHMHPILNKDQHLSSGENKRPKL